MIGLSLSDRFKSLDIYRKLPVDIVQPTFSGALCNTNKKYKNYNIFQFSYFIVSVISSVIMVLLVLSEYSNFLDIKSSSEMFIDINRGGDKVNKNKYFYFLVSC